MEGDANEIPANRDDQVEWLYENWARIDAWLVHGAKPAEAIASASA